MVWRRRPETHLKTAQDHVDLIERWSVEWYLPTLLLGLMFELWKNKH